MRHHRVGERCNAQTRCFRSSISVKRGVPVDVCSDQRNEFDSIAQKSSYGDALAIKRFMAGERVAIARSSDAFRLIEGHAHANGTTYSRL